MSDDNRVAWPIVEAIDAAAVRLARENADLRALVARMRSAEAERDALSNFSRNNEVALASAVDQLALLRAHVAALTAERDAARGIIAGRATAPTAAEIEAHSKAGGTWYVRSGDRAGVLSIVDETRWIASEGGYRWWALDAEGRPCAWPVVEAK